MSCISVDSCRSGRHGLRAVRRHRSGSTCTVNLSAMPRPRATRELRTETSSGPPASCTTRRQTPGVRPSSASRRAILPPLHRRQRRRSCPMGARVSGQKLSGLDGLAGRRGVHSWLRIPKIWAATSDPAPGETPPMRIIMRAAKGASPFADSTACPGLMFCDAA